MKLRIPIIIAALFTVLFMATCGDDNPSAPEPDPDPDPPTNPNLVTKEIGPAGGSLKSSDGDLTLVFPEEALAGTETISIELLNVSELPENLQNADVAWQLGPEGLQFQKPVKVLMKSEQSFKQEGDTLRVKGDLPVLSNGEAMEVLENLTLITNTEDNSVTINGELNHFSVLGKFTGVWVAFEVFNVPEKLEINNTFTAEIFITDYFADDGPADYKDESTSPLERSFEPATAQLPKIDGFSSDVTTFGGSFEYGCNDIGLGVYGSEIGIEITYVLDSGEQISAMTFVKFKETVDCVEVMPEMFTLTVDKEGDGKGTVVSEPEGIDCGTDCDSDNADFEEGSGVILAATATDGSAFDGWSGDIPVACEDSTDPCTLTMDTDRTVTATFSKAEEQAVTTRITDVNSFGLEANIKYETDIMSGGNPDDVELELETGDGNIFMLGLGEIIEGNYRGEFTHTYDIQGEYDISLTSSYKGEFANVFEINFITQAPPEIENIEGGFTGTGFAFLNFNMKWFGPVDNLDATFDGDGDGANVEEMSIEKAVEEDLIMSKIEYEYSENLSFPVTARFEVTNRGSGESNIKTIEVGTVTLTVKKEGEGTVTGLNFLDEKVITCGSGPDCEAKFISALLPDPIYGIDGPPVKLTAVPDNGYVFDGWSDDTGDLSPTKNLNINIRVNRDRNVTATFVKETSGDVLKTGLLLQAVLLNDFEALIHLADRNDVLSKSSTQSSFFSNQIDSNADKVSFGSITGNFPVAVAGAEGFVVVDLLTEEVLMDETGFGNTGPFFGLAGVTQEPPGANSPAVLQAFGQNGSAITRFDKFGTIAGSSPTFDAFPAGGDIVSNVMTIVRPLREVSFWVFDANQGIYVTAESSAEFDDGLFEGELVSAYMHNDVLSDNVVPQPRGSFLVLTRGTESKLYLASWDPKDVTEVVNNIGFDARKVRCIDNGSGTTNLVCAVSVFGDSRLAILTWDGESMPDLVGFADVGNGPIGIDLRLLANGNIAVVSTGFNDNTLTETEVAPDGSIISNSTRAVLDGCQSPGHAIYVQDDESVKVVGTCFDSDAIFIMESEF